LRETSGGERAARLMDVFLVRHAIAHERNRTRWPRDAVRPLTAAGKRRFRRAASGLASCLPKSALLLTSPFVRARDTANILAKVARLRKPGEAPELASGKPTRGVFELLRAHPSRAVILVGHEPALSAWMAVALAGKRARLDIEFKKGGAACLRFARVIAPGRATLVWMLPPRLARSLG
jgi:phosphohistidine phosphatase